MDQNLKREVKELSEFLDLFLIFQILINFFFSPDVKENAWDRFIASIRARLNVAQIVEEVTKDAQITFDFVLLVIIAA